ncbi:MAG: DUF6456 domain-containing protein [Hyphomicrobiales bacterium]
MNATSASRVRKSGSAAKAVPPLRQSESPLAWLYNRRDRAGRRLLSEAQFQAGEQLRRDYDRAQCSPQVTSRWEPGPRSPLRPGSSLLTASEQALAARERVHRALEAVGGDLASILLKVCCLEQGLEQAERALGWPTRSGKLVLQIALERLAVHYGIRG